MNLLLEDQHTLMARNLAELTQGLPFHWQAIETQELPAAGLHFQPNPSLQAS